MQHGFQQMPLHLPFRDAEPAGGVTVTQAFNFDPVKDFAGEFRQGFNRGQKALKPLAGRRDALG